MSRRFTPPSPVHPDDALVKKLFGQLQIGARTKASVRAASSAPYAIEAVVQAPPDDTLNVDAYLASWAKQLAPTGVYTTTRSAAMPPTPPTLLYRLTHPTASSTAWTLEFFRLIDKGDGGGGDRPTARGASNRVVFLPTEAVAPVFRAAKVPVPSAAHLAVRITHETKRADLNVDDAMMEIALTSYASTFALAPRLVAAWVDVDARKTALHTVSEKARPVFVDLVDNVDTKGFARKFVDLVGRMGDAGLVMLDLHPNNMVQTTQTTQTTPSQLQLIDFDARYVRVMNAEDREAFRTCAALVHTVLFLGFLGCYINRATFSGMHAAILDVLLKTTTVEALESAAVSGCGFLERYAPVVLDNAPASKRQRTGRAVIANETWHFIYSYATTTKEADVTGLNKRCYRRRDSDEVPFDEIVQFVLTRVGDPEQEAKAVSADHLNTASG